MSDAAGVDVSAFLHALIATTEEIDYAEMLDWFGLRFRADATPAAPGGAGAPAPAWTLEVRPETTPAQREHWTAFLAKSKKP